MESVKASHTGYVKAASLVAISMSAEAERLSHTNYDRLLQILFTALSRQTRTFGQLVGVKLSKIG